MGKRTLVNWKTFLSDFFIFPRKNEINSGTFFHLNIRENYKTLPANNPTCKLKAD